MKVTSSSALPLVLLLVACSYASPMFGTGGMMKRKFPGASEMSYRTYREIANSNAAAAASGTAAEAGGAAIATRSGGSNTDDPAWMFENVFATPSLTSSKQPGSVTQTDLSFNQQQPSFNQQSLSFNQQQPSFNQQPLSFNQQQQYYNQQGVPFYPQDFQDTFQAQYPSVWDPQDSYAFLQFPNHAPTPLDYDDAFVPQKKIFRNRY